MSIPQLAKKINSLLKIHLQFPNSSIRGPESTSKATKNEFHTQFNFFYIPNRKTFTQFPLHSRVIKGIADGETAYALNAH